MPKLIRPIRYENAITQAMRRATGNFTAPAPTLAVEAWQGTRAA